MLTSELQFKMLKRLQRWFNDSNIFTELPESLFNQDKLTAIIILNFIRKIASHLARCGWYGNIPATLVIPLQIRVAA